MFMTTHSACGVDNPSPCPADEGEAVLKTHDDGEHVGLHDPAVAVHRHPLNLSERGQARVVHHSPQAVAASLFSTFNME